MTSSCPPAKRFCSDPATKDYQAEGTIKLVISNWRDFLGYYEKQETAFNNIGGLPWRLVAKMECNERTDFIKFISVFIHCNPDSYVGLWSCEAIVEIRLHNQKKAGKPFIEEFNHKFNVNQSSQGSYKFMAIEDIQNLEKGYIKKGTVIFEAHVKVKETKGIRLNPRFDFSAPLPNCSDGILVIGDVLLHINKAYLALYSPVFSAMFFGEFKERNSDQIPLQDTTVEEFVEMLNVIYPSHKSISADTVEFLLKLGDKYEVQYVMKKCEKFLAKTDEIPIIKKLAWADQYGLIKLLDGCVGTFKKTGDIKTQIKMREEYKDLGDATKVALLEKVFKLI